MIGDVNADEINATVNEYIRRFLISERVNEPLIDNNIDNDSTDI